MDDINLLMICVIAFIAVLSLLSILAGAMQALTALFPAAATKSDDALAAAIQMAVAEATGGGRVTRMEEIKRS